MSLESLSMQWTPSVFPRLVDELGPFNPFNVSHAESFDFAASDAFFRRNAWWIWLSIVAYAPVIFGLEVFMRNRRPMSLKYPLVLWNWALAVFSILAARDLVPVLFAHLKANNWSIVATSCDLTLWNEAASVWFFWFNLSKLAEFVDTIFLRLRKRPVILLHWIHHVLTAAYSYYCNTVSWRYNAAGVFFCNMNLVVHSIMYSYYALAAMGYGRALAGMGANMAITTLQILQMVGGIAVTITSYDCGVGIDLEGLLFAGGMYLLYLILFSQLFVDKYFGSGGERAKKGAKKEKDQ